MVSKSSTINVECLHLLPCLVWFVGISLFVSFMKTLFFMLCLSFLLSPAFYHCHGFW